MNLSVNTTAVIHLKDERPESMVGVVNDQLMWILNIILIVILCQIVCVFGTIANIINLIVFVRIGFSDSIYISLTALAVCDLSACFVIIWNSIGRNPWFQELDLPIEPVSVSYLTASWPHVIFSKMSTYLTAFISFERCLCVMLPLRVKTIITRRRVKLFVAITFVSGIGKFALLYTTQWCDWKYFPKKNKSLIGVIFIENIDEMDKVYYPILYVGIPFFCFTLVAVCTILLVFSLVKNLKWKQKAVSTRTTNSSSDGAKAVSSKEMKVAKMVTTLSSLYIVCYIPLVYLMFLMVADRSVSINGTNRNLFRVMGAVCFLLQSVNSACNIFIYHRNSSAYRTMIKLVFSCQKEETLKPFLNNTERVTPFDARNTQGK